MRQRQPFVCRFSGRGGFRRVPASLQRPCWRAHRTRGFLVLLRNRGREISRSVSIPPLPNPSPTRGEGLEMQAAPVVRSSRSAAPRMMSRRPDSPPLAGEGPGERGDARCGIHLPPQAALAALGLGRASAVSSSRLLPSYASQHAKGAGASRRNRLQRVTTSRCIGASLASSLFCAANGTPLACIASCRISTSALNSSRRMSSPSCDSAMLRPL